MMIIIFIDLGKDIKVYFVFRQLRDSVAKKKIKILYIFNYDGNYFIKNPTVVII